MNVLLLYLLLLKATCTSFSGLASLPVLRADLVDRYHVLTDTQINAAVTAGRTGPGPMGLYVVCVGYQVARIPGAVAGLLATMTPAFLIVVLLRWIGQAAAHPAVRRTTRAVLIAGAGLLASTSVELTATGVRHPFEAAMAILAFALLVATRVDGMWVMLGAAAAGAVKALLFG
jgi:chromate transporter